MNSPDGAAAEAPRAATGPAGVDRAGTYPDVQAAGSFALGRWRVNRIGYGAMQLAGDNVFGPPRDRDEALGVLRAAVASGINHIDTAQYYGPGVVNELIREALHPYPDNLAIVSKVAARRDEDRRRPGLRRARPTASRHRRQPPDARTATAGRREPAHHGRVQTRQAASTPSSRR